MIHIKLTPTELLVGVTVGGCRRIKSLQGNDTDKKHADKQGPWEIDVTGAQCEMAYAKYLGVYWDASNGTYSAPDVANHKVRGTSYMNGHLIVRPRDFKQGDPDWIFVLVIGQAPDFYVVGWIAGTDAKQDKYWNGDSWWVPQSTLSLFEKRTAIAV